MNTPKVVIGIIGEQWSGKDTFAHIIFQLAKSMSKKVQVIKFSAILTETLDKWGIPSNLRKNRRKLFDALRENFKEYGNPLVNFVKKQIIGSYADIVVINSLKWPDDVEMIRQFNQSIIVYITADFKKRFQHCQVSKGRNIEKINYEGKDYDEFVLEENDPGEIFITQIGNENADVKIYNNGTIEEFIQEVQKFYDEKIAPVI